MNCRKIDIFFVVLLILELIAMVLLLIHERNFLRSVLCVGMILGTVYNWKKIRKL